MRDSGEEVIISYDAGGRVLDSGGGGVVGGEPIMSAAAEEAIIAHYEDFHLFMYGYIPFFVAVLIVFLSCIWLFKTFTR